MPKVSTPQHRIRIRVLVEPDGLKWTSDFEKYGVYTGTKEADNKISGTVISNLETFVNLYSRVELSFRGKVSPCNLGYAVPVGT